MSVRVTSVDFTTHPAALLPLAKSHLRVDHMLDDAYIVSCIARAIGKLQDMTGVTINPTTVVWTPTTFATATKLPVHPATEFTAAAGTPPADVSSNYAILLKWDDITGVPIQILQGAFATGLSVTLQAGYKNLQAAPSVLDRVLRHTSHLYEHREILLPGSAYVAPDLELDATWWLPRL